MKIFIIDDDTISNELSRIILGMSGVEDIEFKLTGKDAIQYLDVCVTNDDFPDLIFVDLNLPGMSGFTFIEYYEDNYKDRFPETGIIMLTNSIIDSDRYKAMQYISVIDFWSKPLTSNNIDEVIGRYKIKT